MKAAELYKKITDAIIKDLEAGAAPWTKPWISPGIGSVMPHNAATSRPYSGINVPILWCEALDRGYTRHLWLTYRQATQLSAHIKKGEKGTPVFFTKKIPVGEEDDKKLISFLRTYYVFNVSQVEGLKWEAAPIIEHDPFGCVDAFVNATKAKIVEGPQPLYSLTFDRIEIPHLGRFTTPESYYATLLHELAHWSGPRLERDLKNRFGTKAYAAEELVAELTAAFLCAHLGIRGELRHAGYIGNWIELLKEDEKAIVTASSKASQAADYLRAFSERVDAEVD